MLTLPPRRPLSGGELWNDNRRHDVDDGNGRSHGMQFSVGDLAQRDELRMYAMMAKEKKAEKTKTLPVGSPLTARATATSVTWVEAEFLQVWN